MTRAPVVHVAVALAIALSVGACGAVAPSATPESEQPGGEPVLGIANGTRLAVTLFVNGTAVGTTEPGGSMGPIVFSVLPPFPWTVEARSSTGRVLTSMAVRAGSISHAQQDGSETWSGAFGRVDLSCGRLTIWAGYNQPNGPPPLPSSGAPGDCEP